MANADSPLLHICYAPADRGWVHGRMVRELGLDEGQYRTREDDGLGELQLQAIADAVEQCQFTVLIASNAARWDKLAQFAAGLAQHAGLEDQTPRLIIIARDFALTSDAERARLSLAQRALVGLDCSDEAQTAASFARLRKLLAVRNPVDERPPCPYPGLARFTAANRDLLFGRDQDKDNLVQRIRAGHSRILLVGPSGSGKSSLLHAAVLPELAPADYVVKVVPRGDHLAAALREVVDALEVPELGVAVDSYVATVRGATDAQIEEARARLRTVLVPDARRRIVVVDPLEEVFAEDAASREALFALLDGLWSVPWCTVLLCMRADFYGALMALRCWRELESCQYPVAPLDEAGLRAAIVAPAMRAGVHVDAALVERLICEIDRDRSSVPLPLLQVALKELWAHLRWRYLTLADYERIVDRDQRGLAAVLAVHADGVLQRLTAPGDRVVAQRILLDLVHLGEGRPHTRRRRAVDDLRHGGDALGQLERVLDQLIEDRLVTTGDGVEDGSHEGQRAATAGETSRFGRHVDLAHDTLITGWPELAGWIAKRRDDLRTQRRLETRADTGVLLTSAELPEFLRWVESTATPTGQLLGASNALRALVRRSVVARRLRRGALGGGLAVATVIAIVFGVQAQRLREEKRKTQQSISEAMETANAIVIADAELHKLASASAVRERLLKRSRELVDRLGKLGDITEVDQRTATAGKAAEAQLAFERGHLDEASALYRAVLADAQRRAAADPSNTLWQCQLSESYDALGSVTVRAGRLEDARGWFDKRLAVAQTLATAAPCNRPWQRALARAYGTRGDVAVRAGKLEDARGWFGKSLGVAQALAAADPNNPEWQRDLLVAYDRLGDVAVRAMNFEEARSWFDKSLGVAQALAAADPSDPQRQRDLAVAYSIMGNVAVGDDKLEEARDWFDKAFAVDKTLATADPSNPQWQRDLSVACRELGDVAVHAGKLEDARGWFEKALAVPKVFAAADPSNNEWQHDLSSSYESLGDIALLAGKLEDARGWFDKILAVRKALATADPSNNEWQHDLSRTYEKLGEVAVRTGKPQESRGWFDKTLAVRKALAAVDPNNTEWQRDVWRTYYKLGDVAVSAGRLKDAHGWFDKHLAVAKALAAIDPSNTRWRGGLLLAYARLGHVAVSAGQFEEARGWFDQALAAAKAAAAADPSNAGWQSGLALVYEKLGNAAVRAGKLEEARGWFGQALAVDKTLAAADPSNPHWQSNLSTSYGKLGDVAVSAGKLEDARGWFAKQLAGVQALAAADRSNPEWQRNLAQSYKRLGEIAVSGGKLEDARGWFAKQLAVAQALAAADPSNTQWQHDLAASYGRLGSIATITGKLADARSWFTKALAVIQVLAATDPGNPERQRDLLVAYVNMGDLAIRASKLEDAHGWFVKALATAQALAAVAPGNTQWQSDLAASYGGLGDVAMTAGKLDDARGWYDKALAVTQVLATAEPRNADWQIDLCAALAQIAQVARGPTEATRYLGEARAIYGRLQRRGLFRSDKRFAQIGATLDLLARSRTVARR